MFMRVVVALLIAMVAMTSAFAPRGQVIFLK